MLYYVAARPRTVAADAPVKSQGPLHAYLGGTYVTLCGLPLATEVIMYANQGWADRPIGDPVCSACSSQMVS
jgi:hypothetical protein